MWWAWSRTPRHPHAGRFVDRTLGMSSCHGGIPFFGGLPSLADDSLNTHQDRRSVTQSGPRVYSFDIDPRLQLAKVVLDYRYCDLENPADLSNPFEHAFVSVRTKTPSYPGSGESGA